METRPPSLAPSPTSAKRPGGAAARGAPHPSLSPNSDASLGPNSDANSDPSLGPNSDPSQPTCGRAAGTSTVSIAVCVRPFLTSERVGPAIQSCVQCLKDSIIIENPGAATAKAFPSMGLSSSRRAEAGVAPEERKQIMAYAGHLQQFSVSQVFNAHCSEVEVYTQSCRSIVKDAFLGINGSILAYGATGSGKTHIMFGGAMSGAGIVYQAMRDIFDEKERLEREAGKIVKLKCSFMEIYNEEVFDLLLTPSHCHNIPVCSSSSSSSSKPNRPRMGRYSSPQKARVQLRSRGSTQKGSERNSRSDDLHISGLRYIYPEYLEEFVRSIEHGHSNRVVATTDSNLKSSRSHAIITVEIKVLNEHRVDVDSSGEVQMQGTVAQINFCDLAGSERAASTTNSGVRLREGGSINRSLLALSAVVRGLIQKKRHPALQVFVPYRGSKLTRILSGCIGGNSRTLMLFCLSPCSNQYEESINTMHFAMQVKQIQINAKRNEYQANSKKVAKYQGALIEELNSEIAALRTELARLKEAQPSSLPTDGKFKTPRKGKLGGFGGAMKASAQRSFLVPCTTGEPLVSTVCMPLQVTSLLRAQSAPRRSSRASVTDTSIRSPLHVLSVASTGASFAEPVSPLTPMMSALRRPPSLDPAGVPLRGNSPSGFVYTELEQKFRRFATEKEMLYHQMRDIQEQQNECDIRLRAQKWKLAQFLASSFMSSSAKGAESSSVEGMSGIMQEAEDTPVGIIGLQQLIQRTEEESAAKGEGLTALSLALELCEHRIMETRQSLLRAPTNEMLELLLDNARLRDSYTEAEGLAAQYYQDSRALQNRQSEYVHALSLAIGTIRALLPNVLLNRSSRHIVEHARSVLSYAHLPAARTSDMITIFRNSLNADPAAPLPPLHPSLPSKNASQRHSSLHSERSDNKDEKQRLQEHYQELLEAAEVFRSTSAPYERGMRRTADSIEKAQESLPLSPPSSPPLDEGRYKDERDNANSREDALVATHESADSGGEEDGAPPAPVVEPKTFSSQLEQSGELSLNSLLNGFPLEYPTKKEPVVNGDANKNTPARSLGRRTMKTPPQSSQRSLNESSGAERKLARGGGKSLMTRFTRTRTNYHHQDYEPTEKSALTPFPPSKPSVKALQPMQIITGPPTQSHKMSYSLIRSNTAVDARLYRRHSPSPPEEAAMPTLIHHLKPCGQFCRAQTTLSASNVGTNGFDCTRSISVLSKTRFGAKKKSLTMRERAILPHM